MNGSVYDGRQHISSPHDLSNASLCGDSVSCVYFIQSERGGPIKIGTTRVGLVNERLKALQTGSPYRLVVRRIVRGNRRVEKWLHHIYRRHRLVGEWFEPGDDLAEIARAVSGGDRGDSLIEEARYESYMDGISEVVDALRPFIALVRMYEDSQVRE